MGSKTTGQSNTSSSYSPPPDVLANYKAVTQQATNVAATPYQAYSGPLVAGINGQQSTGINAVNDASGIQNGFNAGATGLAAASSGAINPTQYSASQLQQYENPYQSDVINATEAQIQNQNQQQAANLTASNIGSGAFGGDRAGLSQAALAGQQDIANNATLANLNAANFTNAQGEFNTQQGVNLSAGQNTAARQLAASQQLGNLGQTAQGEALTEANAQTNAGTLQQTTQQAQDTAAYNQFLQQEAYPFQTTGWLANIVEGIGSQSGGSSTGQTTQTGSAGSGIAGGLLGLASFLKRGGRVGEERIHKDVGGALSANTLFDPTTGQALGLGAGTIVPQTGGLAVGHTMPTAQAPQVAAGPSAGQQGQQISQEANAIKKMGGQLKNLASPFASTAAATPAVPASAVPATDPTQLSGAALTGAADDTLSSGLSTLGDDALSGLGALGGFFAGGGLVRRHFDDGGDAGGDGNGNPGGGGVGQGGGAVSGGVNGHVGGGTHTIDPPVTPPTPTVAPHALGSVPANAPSYSVFPTQMSDGTWSTIGGGIAAPTPVTIPSLGLASGGRVKFADGGTPDDYLSLSPESLLADDAAHPNLTNAAANLPTPEAALAAQYANQMPVPPVATSAQSQLAVAMGGQPLPDTSVPNAATPAPAFDPSYGGLVADQLGNNNVPLPPVRPADLPGSTPTPSQADIATLGHAMGAPDVAPAGLAANSPAVGATAANATSEPTGLAVAAPVAPVSHTAVYGKAGPLPGAPSSGLASAAIAPGNAGNPLGILKSQIANYESGNNYAAIGPTTGAGDHAYGKYQVMGANIPSWTKEALGYAQTPEQFLHDRGAQEAVASLKLGQYLNQYGNPQDAASAWFTGKPLAAGANLKDVNGVSGSQYVANTAGAPTTSTPPKWSDVLADNAEGSANIAAREKAMATQPVPNAASPAPSSGLLGNLFGSSATNEPRTGLMGLNFSDATRQGMLAAGLGMMGGTSRSALVNIGQGGLQGLAAYNNARNLNSEIGLRGAETQGKTAEATMKSVTAQRMIDRLLQQEKDNSTRADNMPEAKGAPAVTAPTLTAPTVAPVAGQPSTNPNHVPTDDWNLSKLTKQQNDAMADAEANMPGAAERLHGIAERIASINAGNAVPFKDGTSAPDPAVAATKAAQAKAIAESTAQAGTMGDTQKAQLAARNVAWEKANEGNTMIQQAQAVKDIMFDPKTGKPNINSGPLAPQISRIAAMAEQLGISNPTVKLLTGTDPNNAQEVEKLKIALGSETARQDLTGNKITQSEWKQFLTAVPGEGLLPGALKYLLDKSIIPKAQQQIGAYNAVKGMHPENGDDVQGTYTKYNIENPWYKPESTSQSSAVSAPPTAVDFLRKNPNLAPAFDQKYGAGASRAILGQ